MSRLLSLALLLVLPCTVWSQAPSAVVFSGFQGGGGGWTTSMENMNGTWTLTATGTNEWTSVKPTVVLTRIGGVPASQQNPPGAMVRVARIRGCTEVVTYYNTTKGYVPFMHLGVPNHQNLGTILLDVPVGLGFPVSGYTQRTIVVQ